MKTSIQKLFLPAVLAFISSIASVNAADLLWDADAITPGVQDGSGTWDTATSNWSDDGVDNVLWDNITPANAVFGTNSGIAGAITIAPSTTINVGNLTVNASSAGNYNFTTGDTG